MKKPQPPMAPQKTRRDQLREIEQNKAKGKMRAPRRRATVRVMPSHVSVTGAGAALHLPRLILSPLAAEDCDA